MDPSSSTSASNGPFREALRQSQVPIGLALLLTGLAAWYANHAVTSARRDSIPERAVFDRLRSPRAYEVIVLGSSRGKHGIDPAQFADGTSESFNYALPGAAARMSWVMTELFLEQENTVELVLLEVNPTSFDPVHLWRRVRDDVLSMGLEPSVRLHSKIYGRENLNALGELYVEAIPLWGEAAPPELLLLGVDYYDPIREARRPGTSGDPRWGFSPLPELTAEALAQRPATFEPVNREPAEVAALEALIQRLQAAGARVVLVQTPTLLRPDEDPYPDFAAEIEQIAARYTLLELDYRHGPLRSAVAGELSNFYDTGHLSEAGARTFSRELWAELQRQLPPK